MASKCRKFVPNMFNKSKCQACFGSKEAHSAAALENNKASQKVSKCGYLFVSPDFDFSNPLDRTRRWQRRFFRLYDDGELTYCVDENADTVPQGSVDMNKCTDILDAEIITTHPNSIAVVTPEKTEYFKADSREEIQWWHDVLVDFPNKLKAIKTKRKPNFIISSNKEYVQPDEEGESKGSTEQKGRFEVEKVRQSQQDQSQQPQQSIRSTDLPAYATFRGVRSLKHKYDKNHLDGMRKSSSLHDLSSEDKELAAALASSRFLSCSGDRLDILSPGTGRAGGANGGRGRSPPGGFSINPYFTIPRTSWPSRVYPSGPLLTAPAAHPSLFNSSSSISSSSSTNSATTPAVRHAFPEDRSPGGPTSTMLSPAAAASGGASAVRIEKCRRGRERSTSLKDFSSAPTQLSLSLSLPRDSGGTDLTELRRATSVGSSLRFGEAAACSLGSSLRSGEAAAEELPQNVSADETDSNETDELKMARSSELIASNRVQPIPVASISPEASPTKYEDLVYMKKGWLIKQGSSDRESKKHWFVLAGNSLRYYQDAKGEETNNLDGRIDLSTCYEVSEIPTQRNYGFKIKTRNGEYILAAMTSGIRSNWMKAIRLCMDLHSSSSRLAVSTSLTGKPLTGRTMDDLELGAISSTASPAPSTSTAVVTGSKGETMFQLVGRRDPGRKETRNVRRHHSDVNPGHVSKIFSIKEFSTNIDSPSGLESLASNRASSIGDSVAGKPVTEFEGDKALASSSSPRASKIARHHSPSADLALWGPLGLATTLPMKRYVEGSDSTIIAAPVIQGGADGGRRSKRNITSESSKEEEKRELMRRAKSPSARIKEKSRAAKAPRLHSPSQPGEDVYDYGGRSSFAASHGDEELADVLSDSGDDVNINEQYHSSHSVPEETHSDTLGEGSMMVEILESEVESLKERLDRTQNQLVKMHETNMDLKTRLQKESCQSLDGSFSSDLSGHWSQNSSSQTDQSQVQTLKRQLKDTKDTVQKQRAEIENLKSKLDMSVSKLTGTEKALSEALKEYKQEKDKFLKLSSEWNRKIKNLEGQVRESTHKLEHSRELQQNKERECRHLELEVKQQQQKTRDQERDILKLKAIEHEYSQLKERLDNKELELHKAHTDLRQKEMELGKTQAEFEDQLSEVEREFAQERDDLENHLEELKRQLHLAKERQSTLNDSVSQDAAALLREKDDIIAQLEEKLIENDHKMVNMQEELQGEMSENADLAHSLDILQDEKQTLQDQLTDMEKTVVSLRDKVADLEKDNSVLSQQLEKLRHENAQLSARLQNSSGTDSSSASTDTEKAQLEKNIEDLNRQIKGLQHKLIDHTQEDHGADDLLHNILILDSDLKEVNSLLSQLHERFSLYLSTLPSVPAMAAESKKEAAALVEMVDEIGHRCLLIQGTLQEGTQGVMPENADYSHTVTVTPLSDSSVIMGEYTTLKGKFDRLVAELKKTKREMTQICEELEKKDVELENAVSKKESYTDKVDGLVQRVDQLAAQLCTKDSTSALQAHLQQQLTVCPLVEEQEVDQQLQLLITKIGVLEKSLANVPLTNSSSFAITSPSSGMQHVVTTLKDLGRVVESTSKDLEGILRDLSHSNPAGNGLALRLNSCSQKLQQLSKGLEVDAPSDKNSSDNLCVGGGGGSLTLAEGTSGMARCMLEITERIQEIGEQLDCMEDEAEDSDDDEGEATTVEDVRERLANLCEYVKQHSQYSNYDWRLRQLLEVQKMVITKARQADTDTKGNPPMDKLQEYADRLSLESLILVEMSHLLENKEDSIDSEESDSDFDPVMQELRTLNSKVLALHRKLDSELRTLCGREAGVDILRVQADIIAEKILIEGHLCSATFSQKNEDLKGKKEVQPRLLATEALLRSQLDSYIGHNLDKTCDELWSSASHLTTRSLVQGELTFALASLKKLLADNQASHSNIRDFSFEHLKVRHKAVMKVAQAYQTEMVRALAVIARKESEEMTLVEGPETVLDTMCSEVSTIIETHIQRCKKRVRSSNDTNTARRFDMMVNRLRSDREATLASIRLQHDKLSNNPDAESDVELPFQSLDSSINNFGEIMSLCSILSAHVDFVSEMLRMGDVSALAGMELEEEDVKEDEEEDEPVQKGLQKGLCSFVHSLAEALQAEALSKKAQVSKLLEAHSISTIAASVPSVPQPMPQSDFSEALAREAVFAAQTTFLMYKLKLLHEQEMDALRAARPVRSKPQKSSDDESEGSEADLYQTLVPLEDVLETKFDDEIETLRVIAAQVGKLEGVVQGRNWVQVEEHVRQLEQKVQDELELSHQKHEVHLDLFKQEEAKVERVFEDTQQERDHFEERSAALEAELRAVTSQHDDEVERMRQDVMTAVSAIRANEEESETHLSDRLQVLTKQMLLQKDKFKRFLAKLKSKFSGGEANEMKSIVELVEKELSEAAELPDDEELPPLPSQPPPDAPHAQDKHLKMEEEIELLKKEKDEALAEETRNTKAALDAMRKAYEEELQQERAKYRECLTTMYNEDFVSEIRHRHQQELEKAKEELKQVKMHYLSKCEDLKLLEVKLGQTKQDYESHINQLIMSNAHLDDMVNQEIGRLKDFIKNRPANLTTGNATMEEELYDAQIMTRVKDAELQKLRSQVKNFENSLHRTTEEHRQTMTQYLQALKENQEMRKEYQAEVTSLREQLDKALNESGARRPIRRTPSFHQRARSPSPSSETPQRRDSTSTANEHASRDANRRRRIDPKDLRRSKSSPSLPYVFDAKGVAAAIKSPAKDRRSSQKT